MINLEAIPLVGRLLQVEATARVDLETHGSDGLIEMREVMCSTGMCLNYKQTNKNNKK